MKERIKARIKEIKQTEGHRTLVLTVSEPFRPGGETRFMNGGELRKHEEETQKHNKTMHRYRTLHLGDIEFEYTEE